ncbi:g12261 [Coccomyxa viridis]|uniref:G12261 protein n=1 Tax=Coccomyxa viridis TaxID=1274662 RepID=A0ABP1GA93_9CHLO
MGLARMAHRRSTLCSLSRCLTQPGLWSRGFASLPDPIGEEQGPINSKDGKVLHPELLNTNFVNAEYAVRGELYLKGEELRKQGKEIIFTNVGNPHALGQKPRTFNRQVMSLVTCPTLLDHPKVGELFPADVIARAKQCSTYFNGGLGAYTDSRGSEGVRKEVAAYIEKRDGYPSSPDQIFLTDGASPAVRYMLNAIIRNDKDGILVPVPQYPLYSASIQLLGGKLLGYYLREDSNWSMDIPSVKRQVAQARSEGIAVRGLVFINPGNPTGQCLSYDNLKDIIQFCQEEEIVLMADEVYQTNIYQDERPFVSCKKVMMDMGEPYSKHELLSFHTVSKGALGECGLRGGYVETTNIHPGTVDQIYKIASINLSPNTTGQLGMALMVNPPEEGSESYEQWKQEESSVMESLRRRAQIMTDGFNACEGVSCTFTEGAMYSFPRLDLPQKAVQAAKQAGKSPDTFYCLKLLEDTGILTVPGSGFGQEEGTLHLRTTILPMEEKIKEVMSLFQNFHKKFMDEYR